MRFPSAIDGQTELDQAAKPAKMGPAHLGSSTRKSYYYVLVLHWRIILVAYITTTTTTYFHVSDVMDARCLPGNHAKLCASHTDETYVCSVLLKPVRDVLELQSGPAALVRLGTKRRDCPMDGISASNHRTRNIVALVRPDKAHN